jgi:hypothetical protein
MATDEISKVLPYSPRATKPPARKCRDYYGLALRAMPETHECQFLVLGLPAEQG